MRKSDFQTKEHNQKKSLEFPTKIKDKDQVLRAVLSLNSQKGTYDVTIKIGIDKVTGDDVLDKAMLQSAMNLAFHGIKECQAFRKNWLNAQPKENPDQKSLFDKDAKKEAAKEAAKERASSKPKTKSKAKAPAKRKVGGNGKIAKKKIGAK